MNFRKKILTVFIGVAILVIPHSTYAFTKSETIYTNLKLDGEIEKSSVTNHLAFLESQKEIDDTTLEGILNINGNEKFKADGNKIIWENKGRDIFYRGTTETLLPIDVKVEYFLNDKKMNPKKIVGKKGNIKIIYHFTNRDKKVVQIAGENEMLYTPFVVSMGIVIDGKNNKDFIITNGKVISTGTRNMIVGLSSPGLYESTGIEKLKDWEDITLTYSTSSFSLQNAYIVATPKFLSEKEFTMLDKMDEVYQNMNQLEQNMQQLVHGTKELSNGTESLYDGSQTLRDNIAKLQDASSQLKNGSIKLNEGLTALKNALIPMNDSIKDKLQGKSIEEVITTLQNLQSQNNIVIQNTLQMVGKNFDELQTIYIQNNLQNQQFQGNNDPLSTIKNAYETILLFNGNNSAINISLSLLSSFQQVEVLLSSIEQLEIGSSTLKNGLSIMEDGTKRLYQGSLDMEQGLKKLAEGSHHLEDGTKAFQNQGIKPLVGYAHTIKKYNNKVDALIELSKEYKGFASKNSDSTLFVYTISSIK